MDAFPAGGPLKFALVAELSLAGVPPCDLAGKRCKSINPGLVVVAYHFAPVFVLGVGLDIAPRPI